MTPAPDTSKVLEQAREYPPMPEDFFSENGLFWRAMSDWLLVGDGDPDGKHADALEAVVLNGMRAFADATVALRAARATATPIDMVLHCPKCGAQHVDAADPPVTVLEATLRAHPLAIPAPSRWDNPPHRSHLCHGCGHIWRPADVPTNGVPAVKTTGKADSPLASPAAPACGVLSDVSLCAKALFADALETDDGVMLLEHTGDWPKWERNLQKDLFNKLGVDAVLMQVRPGPEFDAAIRAAMLSASQLPANTEHSDAKGVAPSPAV